MEQRGGGEQPKKPRCCLGALYFSEARYGKGRPPVRAGGGPQDLLGSQDAMSSGGACRKPAPGLGRHTLVAADAADAHCRPLVPTPLAAASHAGLHWLCQAAEVHRRCCTAAHRLGAWRRLQVRGNSIGRRSCRLPALARAVRWCASANTCLTAPGLAPQVHLPRLLGVG